MWMRRLRREIDELNQQCELAADHEERASFELTRSARAFSQRTREVADDKLAFSATLMRAGEVEAANRLIEDLEVDVRTEEAALVEQVNEVKVVTAVRREKMTRLRLARTLAAATLSAGLLMVSAMGIAVASFIEDLTQGSGLSSSTTSGVKGALTGSAVVTDAPGGMKSIRFADGTEVKLSKHQFRELERMTRNGEVDRSELERLLAKLVGPEIAGKLAAALTEINSTTQAAGELADRLGDKGAAVTTDVTKQLPSKPKDTKDKDKSSSKPSKAGEDKPVDDEPVDEPDDPAHEPDPAGDPGDDDDGKDGGKKGGDKDDDVDIFDKPLGGSPGGAPLPEDG